jgi:serine/threonine-protein kinase
MQLDGDEALAPGTKLGGRFEIVRLIGSGGMAAVYEALHVDLKKRVAIKALFPSVGRNPEARTRFLREGEVASRIRHPHVVDVTDVGSDGGLAFLVMEFLEGEDLGALVDREAPLAVDRTVDLLLPVMAAVAAGHAAGVVHRDLKPQNIFLAKGFRGELVPKVLDFGVSKLMTGAAALTHTAAVFGTPAYMSPEQALGAKQVDARCDQYALALIFYECLTGRRAFDGENALAILRRIGDGIFDPPSRHRPDLPPALERVLLTALAREASSRFPSLNAFGAAVLPFASGRARATWAETFTASAVTEPGFHAPTMKLAAVASRAPSTTMPVPATDEPAPDDEPALPTDGRRRIVTLAVAAAAVAGGLAWLLHGSPKPAVSVHVPAAPAAAAPAPTPPPSVRQYAVAVKVDPAEATLELDGEAVGHGSWSAWLKADGRAHTLRASAAGFTARTIEFRDQPPPPSIALEKLPAPHPARHKPKPGPARDDDVLLNRR